MKIRKDLIPGLLLVVLVVTGGSIYYKMDMKRKQEILDSLKSEYPQISIDEILTGEITHIYHGHLNVFNNSPDKAYIEINSITKRRITTSYSINEMKLLDEVLSFPGLYIYKEMGSDRLSIYTIQNGDTTIYIFKILDDLGYPLDKHYD